MQRFHLRKIFGLALLEAAACDESIAATARDIFGLLEA
jgi:hypothetical protein